MSNPQTPNYNHETPPRGDLDSLVAGVIPESSPESIPTRMLEVCNYIHDHCHRPVPLTEVSELAGLHPHHMSTTFRKSCGVGFRTFLTRCRLSRACELLQDKSLLINTVAQKSGFRSVSQFNRSFLQHNHTTPSKYRNSLGKNENDTPFSLPA